MQAATNKHMERNMQMGACDSMHMIQVDSSSDLDKRLCCMVQSALLAPPSVLSKPQ